MYFELRNVDNKEMESEFQNIMSELDTFYGIGWTRNIPIVIFVESRDQMDRLLGRKTDDWVVGTTEGRIIFVMKNDNMEKESSHKKYSDEAYYALLKHEISHCFCTILSNHSEWMPKWLWEGVAIYTSGEHMFKKKIDEFKNFLNFYDAVAVKGVYEESGFAVGLLVEKFGKEKLLNLIRNAKHYPSKDQFENAFEGEYGFKPDYDNFNALL